MLDQLRAMMTRRRNLHEVASLSERDLSDIGVSRGQIDFLMHLPDDTADRVTAMAAVFGVTPEQLADERAAFLDMVGTCGTCAVRNACGHSLAKGALKGPEDCGFCPNWSAFEELTRTAA